AQDRAPASSQHFETSNEPEADDASKELSNVSQQASSTVEPVVALEHNLEIAPTQDDVASVPVVEKSGNLAIVEAPANNESAPSTEEDVPSATATVEESAAKDVDVPSDLVLAADHMESSIKESTPASLPAEQPPTEVVEDSATAEHAPTEKLAQASAITMEEHVAVKDNENTSIIEASSEAVQEHSTADGPRVSAQNGDPALLEETSVVAEAPSVTTETAVAEPSAEPKVSAETALASEEHIGTTEVLASSDVNVARLSVNDVGESADPQEETDVIEQPKLVLDQETVLSQEADAAIPAIPVVEKTRSISAVEEAVSVPVPSAKEEVLVEQVQGVPVEEVPCNSVETGVETAVEGPVSSPVAEKLTQHEDIQAPIEESTTPEEILVGTEEKEKVESPKDVPIVESSTIEAPISDLALTEKEQVQTDAVVQGPEPTETAVSATAEEVDSISTAETVVAKHEEILDVENNHTEDVIMPKDQIEPPHDPERADECTTTAAATSVETVTVEPLNVNPAVTTIVADEETSTEEPKLSQEDVESIIAAVPSVAEPANVAEIESKAGLTFQFRWVFHV
ncbi:hypothetical protein C0992_004489, partial [Termitomyces sp. T32_za158]